MPRFHWDVAQGSGEWMKLRAGRPTASNFDQVMTPKMMKPSESRKKYGCRLIAERVMNWQADSLETIKHIADGKENEPLAVAKMELVYDISSELIGFVSTDDGRFGASPDRVAGVSPAKDRVSIVSEVKAPTVPIQMERLIFGDNDAYRCQRQGQLWVAAADKAIFFSYNPRMPDYMIEDGRDEEFIGKLVDCLERFADELDEWERKVRARGAFQAFAELVPPVDAAYANSAQELDDLINLDTMKWGG